MKRIIVCLFASAVGMLGCSETPGPAGPSLERPRLDLAVYSTNERVAVLERSQPIAEDLVVRGTIGPSGGSLAIEAAGLTVTFPAGAVAAPTEFRLVAKAGKGVIYEFYPSPTAFLRPVSIRQDLRNTTAHGDDALLGGLQGAYFPGEGALQFAATGTVLVTELLPIRLDLATGSLHFEVLHFSGYLVASGRSEEQ